MWRLIAKRFNIRWIYDTTMSINDCTAVLNDLPEANSYTWSAFSCKQKTDTQLELVFMQPRNGDGRPKKTRYIADFYTIEKSQTVIVLQFVGELFMPIPATRIEEIDKLFEKTIYAFRRQG